jgi:hypothetical protein
MSATAYCFKCKEKNEILSPVESAIETTPKPRKERIIRKKRHLKPNPDGSIKKRDPRPAIVGTCKKCGSRVSRFIKSPETPASLRKRVSAWSLRRLRNVYLSAIKPDASESEKQVLVAIMDVIGERKLDVKDLVDPQKPKVAKRAKACKAGDVIDDHKA